MKVIKSEYLLSAAWENQWPEASVPEIVLAGRSNVGKSSLINTMLNRKALAKVSANPGKTRTLNFFNVNDVMRFVDVPGYGFANVSEEMKKQFSDTVDTYLAKRETLNGVILIVDYRHKPTKDDVAMYEYIKYYDLPVVVVATKMDKLKKSEIRKNEKLIKETLQFDEEHDYFVRFSSFDKTGVEELWEIIDFLALGIVPEGAEVVEVE